MPSSLRVPPRYSLAAIFLVRSLGTFITSLPPPLPVYASILPLALLISTLLPFPSPSLNLITPVGSTSTLMALSAVVVSWKPFLV